MIPHTDTRVAFVVLTAMSFIFLLNRAAGQGNEEKPIVSPSAGAKFAAVPNAPECFTIVMEKGDPGTGPSVMLAKFAPGCIAPFHWHTPSETAMMVSGSLELQMKGDKAFTARHGDFVYLPGHHIHRATCIGTAPCLVFLSSDAAFDVHWVDASGQEVSLESALKNSKARPKSQ